MIDFCFLLREEETGDTLNLPEAAALEGVLLLTGVVAIQLLAGPVLMCS